MACRSVGDQFLLRIDHLFRNLGGGFFATGHQSAWWGRPPASRVSGARFSTPTMTAGSTLTANGHVIDTRPRFPHDAALCSGRHSTTGHLVDVSGRAGAPFQSTHLGRGLAVGDVDNDGRLDAIMLLRTSRSSICTTLPKSRATSSRSPWRVRGRIATRSALGPRSSPAVMAQVAERIGGSSYQSANDPRLHFGLGNAASVESIEIRWPSGQTDRHANAKADRVYLAR